MALPLWPVVLKSKSLVSSFCLSLTSQTKMSRDVLYQRGHVVQGRERDYLLSRSNLYRSLKQSDVVTMAASLRVPIAMPLPPATDGAANNPQQRSFILAAISNTGAETSGSSFTRRNSPDVNVSVQVFKARRGRVTDNVARKAARSRSNRTPRARAQSLNTSARAPSAMCSEASCNNNFLVQCGVLLLLVSTGWDLSS